MRCRSLDFFAAHLVKTTENGIMKPSLKTNNKNHMLSKVFAAAAFMLVSPLFVSAQGILATQPVLTGSLNQVFSVSLEKVSLVPLGGDEYQVDFSLSGTKGFSSPLSYALSLKQQYGTAMFAYYGSHKSEKEFSITSGATISFKDNFSIPSYASGAQDVYLVLLTADGIPLQEFPLGKVIASENTVPIIGFDFNDCYIGIADSDQKNSDQEIAPSPKMPIGSFVGRFEKDITTVHCGVVFENAFPAAYSVGFRVYKTTAQGSVLAEGIMEKELTFVRGEKNIVDIPISDFGVKGRVEVELFLVDSLNKRQATPPLTLSYDIPGEPHGSIGGAFINSDSFKKGDEIGIFVLSSLVPQNYRTVRLDVRDASGGICADMQVPASDIGTLITVTSQSDCASPVVAVTLLNKDGTEIDRLDFAYPSKLPEKTASSEVSATISILLAVLFILLLGAFLILAAKRHLNKRSSILPIAVLAFGFLTNASVIEAQTLPGGLCGYEYTTPGTYTLPVPSDVTQATVSGSGGGAGGAGGSWDSNSSSPGSGGGGGAAAVSNLTLTVIPNFSYTVIVGDGGVGGTGNWNVFGGNPVGTAGGASSIFSLISLPGGNTAYWGGDYYNAGGPAGGAGGQAGGWGYRDCGGTGGKGGDSLFGSGGVATYGVSIPGSNGTGYGAGGSAASGGCGGGAPDGGNGAGGFMRIEWICPGPVNGTCGSANGVAVSSAPASGLCATGSASAVSGSGPWAWTCNGSGGGSTASCSAPLFVPGPTVDLKINGSNGPLSLIQGALKNISWTTANAISCTASSSDGFAGAKSVPSGAESLTATTTSNHTLTCTNASGISTSDSVQVNVSCTPITGTYGACQCPQETKTRTNVSAACLSYTETVACDNAEKNSCRDFNWREVSP